MSALPAQGTPRRASMEGFLMKQGDRVKSWKKRYFHLDPQSNSLNYYRDETKAELLGTIPLQDCSVVLFDEADYDVPHSFGITPANSLRTFLITAESDQQRDTWINALAPDRANPTKVDPTSLKEGYMQKLGNRVKNWKRRYFILNQEELRYYRNKGDPAPAGIIKLQGARIELEADDSYNQIYTFSLLPQVVPTEDLIGRKYIMVAPSKNDMISWVNSLRSVAADPSLPLPVEHRSSEADRLQNIRQEAEAMKLRPDSIREGWLWKLGGQVKNWKQRYFVLTGPMLFYYKQKSKEAPAVGRILLLGGRSQPVPESEFSRKHAFSCTSSDSRRTYVFVAEDEQDCAEWLETLNGCSSMHGSRRMASSSNQTTIEQIDDTDNGGDLSESDTEEKELPPDMSSLSISDSPSSSSSSSSAPSASQPAVPAPLAAVNPISPSASSQASNSPVIAPALPSPFAARPSTTTTCKLSLMNVSGSREENERESQGLSLSALKSKVSKKKRRFVADGFNLDLTYITDRIIAMGFPAENLEGIYRNSMSEVQRFFESRHSGHYKVYNLCSERWYDKSRFHDRVLHFPFDDHNCPNFDDMEFFCEDVANYLNESPENIVAIHCKAGKGRTGLMIAVFLLYAGVWHTSEEALSYYAFARTKNMKGVTIASQIRWVHYFEHFLKLRRIGLSLPPAVSKKLVRMQVSKGHPSFDSIVITNHGVRYTSSEHFPRDWKKSIENSAYEIRCGNNISLLKDVCILFHAKKLFGGKSTVFSLWLNTQFVEQNYLRFTKKDIDKVCKDKKAADFVLELWFESSDPQLEAEYQAHAQRVRDSEEKSEGVPVLPQLDLGIDEADMQLVRGEPASPANHDDSPPSSPSNSPPSSPRH
eukprot:TRINITY_DN1115_c0_g1_i3.p1 TRINITY_DN1115_c0_g1~~TRINITY_DN1115_c0_g1_i3.p1  ORF type:complete len:874 (+),score=260.49 TRINITY_DN1115_c0_g1_i3:115-2736(+)